MTRLSARGSGCTRTEEHTLQNSLHPGDVVRVRRRRWRIVDLRVYDRHELLTLRGIGPVNIGRTLRVVTPFDFVQRIERQSRLKRVRPAVWRRACRGLLAAAAPPGALLGANSARMDLLPYQLEPALALARGLGSRVLLADDVGLGKTVQAGLILSELRARGGADRILILTPSGLREQWVRELGRRFRIDATLVDVPGLRRVSSTLPVGVNPWTTMPVAVTSIDYVKRPEVLPSLLSCPWDVVVVDEAHGCTAGSDRGAAVASLTARTSYLVLVTATPHSGDRESFSSLCSTGSINGDRLLVFRRSRQDVGLKADRRIHRLHVRPSAAEVRMHALVGRFTQEVRRERGTISPLSLSVLHKRALSSASSLERSVARRLTMLSSGDADQQEQLALPLDDSGGEVSPEDEPPAWPAELSLRDRGRERRMLEAIAEAAATASRHESKIRALQRLLRRVDEPAIVFTEFRDTLLHVERRLDRPAILLHGGMRGDERLKSLVRFSKGGRVVLLATDAAGQGLNLHEACRIVVNLELPWNPTRLEQRIGRVDRIGQRRTVHAFHLIARGTGETRILDRLKARLAAARADIRAADPIGVEVETAVARLVVGGTGKGGDISEPLGDVEADRGDLVGPTLVREAVEEAERLARAQRLVPAEEADPPAGLDGAGPAMTRARRWRTRARLGPRLMFLWRVSCEDGCGRALGSTVVPILAPGALAESPVEEIVKRLAEEFRERVDATTNVWRDKVARFHQAFVSTRQDRDRAIALGRRDRHFETFQAGLFDRRGLHARTAAAADERDEAIDWAARVATVADSAVLNVAPAQLLLVLVP